MGSGNKLRSPSLALVASLAPVVLFLFAFVLSVVFCAYYGHPYAHDVVISCVKVSLAAMALTLGIHNTFFVYTRHRRFHETLLSRSEFVPNGKTAALIFGPEVQPLAVKYIKKYHNSAFFLRFSYSPKDEGAFWLWWADQFREWFGAKTRTGRVLFALISAEMIAFVLAALYLAFSEDHPLPMNTGKMEWVIALVVVSSCSFLAFLCAAYVSYKGGKSIHCIWLFNFLLICALGAFMWVCGRVWLMSKPLDLAWLPQSLLLFEPALFCIYVSHSVLRLVMRHVVLVDCVAVLAAHISAWRARCSLADIVLADLYLLLGIICCFGYTVCLEKYMRLEWVVKTYATATPRPNEGRVSVLGFSREVHKDTLYYLRSPDMAGAIPRTVPQLRRDIVAWFTASGSRGGGGSVPILDSSLDSLDGCGSDQCRFQMDKLEYVLNKLPADLLGFLLSADYVPKMNVLLQTVGSRGDVQPFMALARQLMSRGHAVRLAAHEKFRGFVGEEGIEFFPLGDHTDGCWTPEALMKYAETNPTIGPSLLLKPKALGSMALKRAEIAKCVGSIYDPPNRQTGPWPSTGYSGIAPEHNFRAQCVVANPPSYAHVHLAERLGIPMVWLFTMPWTTTREVGHPLCMEPRVQDSETAKKSASVSEAPDTSTEPATSQFKFWNMLSYRLITYAQWMAAAKEANTWRRRALGLKPAGFTEIALHKDRKVPFVYCFSEAVLPRPKDWGPHVDITGYIFDGCSEQTCAFSPPHNLAGFLSRVNPVYVGFGSISSDIGAVYEACLTAVTQLGLPVLVHKGWCSSLFDFTVLPQNGTAFAVLSPPRNNEEEQWVRGVKQHLGEESVLVTAAVPHEWLFPKCKVVVNHGGAGTMAIALKHGKPTLVSAFFGDQPLNGALIQSRGVGWLVDSKQVLRLGGKSADAVKMYREGIEQLTSGTTLGVAECVGHRLTCETAAGGGAYSSALAVERQQPLDLTRCELCMANAAFLVGQSGVGSVNLATHVVTAASQDARCGNTVLVCQNCLDTAVPNSGVTVTELQASPTGGWLDWARATRKLPRFVAIGKTLVRCVARLLEMPFRGCVNSGVCGFFWGTLAALVQFLMWPVVVLIDLSTRGCCVSADPDEAPNAEDIPLRCGVHPDQCVRGAPAEAWKLRMEALKLIRDCNVAMKHDTWVSLACSGHHDVSLESNDTQPSLGDMHMV